MDNNFNQNPQGINPESSTADAAKAANMGELAGTAQTAAAAGGAGAAAKLGFAAAFTTKTLITAIIALVVVCAVAVGGYALATNYVIFPEFGEALANTLEAKSSPLTEFDTERFLEQGKTEVTIDIPEYEIDATVSVSHSKKALQAALKTCGETFTIAYHDQKIAASIEGFNKGQAYGLSIKNLREQIMDSIFAANSGTEYEIDMDTINQICDTVEMITENKETVEEAERLAEFIDKVFKDSQMVKDAKISYSKTEVLGTERSGRSQTLVINKDNLVALIEDYKDAFENAEGKDLEAIEYFIDLLAENEISPVEVELDDIVDALDSVADEIDDLEVLDGVEIKFTVCYVKTYVSAIIISAEVDIDEIEGEKVNASGEMVITLDFGAKPHKTKDMTFAVEGEVKANGQKMTVEGLVKVDTVKDGDVITTTGEMECEVNVPDQEKVKVGGELEIVYDNDKEEATMTLSVDMNGEKLEVMSAEFEYSDSKEKLYFSPKSITAMGEEIEIPFELSITFYRNPDKLKTEKYVDILDMKEKDFEKLGEDLMEYFEDFAADLGDIGELEDVFDDFGNSEVDEVPAYPDYSYSDEDEGWG